MEWKNSLPLEGKVSAEQTDEVAKSAQATKRR